MGFNLSLAMWEADIEISNPILIISISCFTTSKNMIRFVFDIFQVIHSHLELICAS